MICSNAWSFWRIGQHEVPLGDLVVSGTCVCRLRMSLRIWNLMKSSVFMQRPPLPLVVDQGRAEVVPLGHADQGQLGVEHQRELLGLVEEGERVGGRRRGEELVGERDVEDPLQGIGRDPDLPPGVVQLRPAVHQVEPVLQRDPLGGQQEVFEVVLVVVRLPSVYTSRTDRPSMIDVLELGQLLGDLGQVVQLPLRVALPVVDLVEDLLERLGQAPVEDQRDVGRQADLDLELVEVVAVRESGR